MCDVGLLRLHEARKGRDCIRGHCAMVDTDSKVVNVSHSDLNSSDNPGMPRWLPLSIHFGFLFLGVMLHSFWPVSIPVPNSLRWMAVLLCLGLFAFIVLLSLREFSRARTTFHPHQGANALIRSGIFRSLLTLLSHSAR